MLVYNNRIKQLNCQENCREEMSRSVFQRVNVKSKIRLSSCKKFQHNCHANCLANCQIKMQIWFNVIACRMSRQNFGCLLTKKCKHSCQENCLTNCQIKMQFWFNVIGCKLYEPFAYNGLLLGAVFYLGLS